MPAAVHRLVESGWLAGLLDSRLVIVGVETGGGPTGLVRLPVTQHPGRGYSARIAGPFQAMLGGKALAGGPGEAEKAEYSRFGFSGATLPWRCPVV